MRVTKPWTTTDLRSAAAMWAKAAPCQEIADRLGRSLESVKHKVAADRDRFPRRKRLKGTAGALVRVRFEISEYLYARIRSAARSDNVSMTAHMNRVLARHYMRVTE